MNLNKGQGIILTFSNIISSFAHKHTFLTKYNTGNYIQGVSKERGPLLKLV